MTPSMHDNLLHLLIQNAVLFFMSFCFTTLLYIFAIIFSTYYLLLALLSRSRSHLLSPRTSFSSLPFLM